MSCVVCGSADLEEVRPAEVDRLEDVSFSYSFSPAHTKTFRVVRCRQCTHQFCAPLPARVTDSYEDVVDEEYLKHADSRQLASEAVLRVVAKHTVGKRLLDVGCATGDFLDTARTAGYQVEGIELSNWSCRIARARGLVVHQQRLADFVAGNEGRFDVISLFGVIEHFPDPLAEMRSIAQLLTPGGVVVLWTGDVDSWLPRLLGRRWWYCQGQHIQYFTHRSLNRVADRAGMTEVATEKYPFVATHTTLSNSLRRYPLHRWMSAALRPLFAIKPKVVLRLPGEMLFLARRS